MRTILFLLSLFLFIGCDKQDDTKQPEQHNELYGSWYLIKLGTLSGIYNYTNEIEWSFDNNTIDVSIANNTNIPDEMPLDSNGSYSYTINNNVITIYTHNSHGFFYYSIINDTLTLDNNTASSDGCRLIFIKTN